ncbi:IS30 family transposase, partial [Hutsoniella sourekii]
ANGLLREFLPKRTDLAKITEDELFNALWLINNRPRKCLNFKTPFEVFMHELVQLE